MLEQMIITMLLGLLHGAVKNPAKAATLKTSLLEVRDGITALYPDAPQATR
jgi:hypothetical protein